MTLNAALLDVDGTLLDSNAAHTMAWREALRQHGHEVPCDTLRPLIGKGGDKLLKEVADIDDESEEGQRISNTRRALFAEKYLPTLQPTAGARDLLLRLVSNGFRLVVATSASGEELQSLLQQAGVDDLIETAASSSDAKQSKPDPDIVQAALGKAGLRPDEAIMLGDTPYDIDAANAAGVPAVVLRCGGWWTDDALMGAMAIYDDPAELLSRIESSPFSSKSASPARIHGANVSASEAAPRTSESARETAAAQYTELRTELETLQSAPVPDMVAIDAVMSKLDETQAASKSRNRGVDDHQRY